MFGHRQLWDEGLFMPDAARGPREPSLRSAIPTILLW